MGANSDKKVTVGNLAALYQKLKEKFMPNQTPQELRAAMGLGDTLGPLGVEYGGTGQADLEDAVDPYLAKRSVGYSAVSDGEFEGMTGVVSFEDRAALSVGTSAFSGCENLRTVSVAACTSIEDGAFDGCASLESVDMPVCASIGDSAFDGCESLTTVEAPACTVVGPSAFGGCTSLASVRLPACASIGNQALMTHGDLRYVRLGGATLTLPKPSSTLQYVTNSAVGAIDLRGVSTVTVETYTVGSGTIYFPRLVSTSTAGTIRIWIDEGASIGTTLVYGSSSIQSSLKVCVYTDGTSAGSSWANGFSYCTVSYYYDQDYETWLATYGA